MGYQIAYNTIRADKFSARKRRRVPKWLILCLIAAVALSLFGSQLKWILLPGDPVVTGAALSQMVTDIRSGEKLSNAVVAFCKEVISHADVNG